MMNSNSLTPSKKQVLTWSIAASPASPPKCCSSFVPRGQCVSYLCLYTCSIFHFLKKDFLFIMSFPVSLTESAPGFRMTWMLYFYSGLDSSHRGILINIFFSSWYFYGRRDEGTSYISFMQTPLFHYCLLSYTS
jgi:hypothetical protein